MSRVWDLVNHASRERSTLTNGVGVDDVLSRLETGESLPQVLRALGLSPAELIAVLAHAALASDAEREGGLGLVQAPPSRPWLEAALSDAAWQPLIPSAPRPARLALVAGLLQIHDFWDASHNAAQQADDLGERAVSAYWHGIAHRREPDSANASYWFRRVGQHPIFRSLASSVQPLLKSAGDPALAGRLIPGGAWSPFAFIDFCSEGRLPARWTPVARALQRLEMIALLEATVGPLGLELSPA